MFNKIASFTSKVKDLLSHAFGRKSQVDERKIVVPTTKWLAQYQRMVLSCHNQNYPEHSIYGATGATVCEEWRYSFDTFYRDVRKSFGVKVPPNVRLERIDKSRPFQSGNLRWQRTDVPAPTTTTVRQTKRVQQVLPHDPETGLALDPIGSQKVFHGIVFQVGTNGKWRKKRVQVGKATTKLTDSQVRAIRVDIRPPVRIARDYKVSPTTIYLIRQGKSYSHVT